VVVVEALRVGSKEVEVVVRVVAWTLTRGRVRCLKSLDVTR